MADLEFPPQVWALAEELRRYARRCVDQELSAINRDRPLVELAPSVADGAAIYTGRRSDYAPEWYAAHGILTAFNAGLIEALNRALLVAELAPVEGA